MMDRIFEALVKLIIKPNGVLAPQGTNAHIYSGYGTPESSLVAGVGSIYLRTDGGAGTSLYVKESGDGNTGWIGK